MLRFSSICLEFKSKFNPWREFRRIRYPTKRKFPELLHTRKISGTGIRKKRFAFLDWFLTSPSSVKQHDKEGDGIFRKRVKIKQPFKFYQLDDDGPKRFTSITQDEAKVIYEQLLTIRQIEQASDKLYKENVIRGFCDLYIGQEACAVGMHAAMRAYDNVITGHRCHGWCFLMGVPPLGILSELAGKQGGCARGKGGSIHMYAPKFFGGHGIVGSQVPIGAGLALASKLKQDGGACLTVYGDGAAHKGQIFESFNMAKLWKLPCVFVCENNQYGISPVSFYDRGGNVPGIWVDGSDVLAVREATNYAIDFCTEHGPLVLELNTSLNAVSPAMQRVVRQQRDPITLFRRLCVENSLMSIAEIRKIDRTVKYQVDQAALMAKEDKEVPLAELTTDIYAHYLDPKIRTVLGLHMRHGNLARPKSYLKNAKIIKVRTERAKQDAVQAMERKNLGVWKIDS